MIGLNFNSQPKQTPYVSLTEAAKIYPYSQEYLSLRARQGKLKAVKLGRNWYTTRQALEDYISFRGQSSLTKVAKIQRKIVQAYQTDESINTPNHLALKKESFWLKLGRRFFDYCQCHRLVLSKILAGVLVLVLVVSSLAYGHSFLAQGIGQVIITTSLVLDAGAVITEFSFSQAAGLLGSATQAVSGLIQGGSQWLVNLGRKLQTEAEASLEQIPSVCYLELDSGSKPVNKPSGRFRIKSGMTGTRQLGRSFNHNSLFLINTAQAKQAQAFDPDFLKQADFYSWLQQEQSQFLSQDFVVNLKKNVDSTKQGINRYVSDILRKFGQRLSRDSQNLKDVVSGFEKAGQASLEMTSQKLESLLWLKQRFFVSLRSSWGSIQNDVQDRFFTSLRGVYTECQRSIQNDVKRFFVAAHDVLDKVGASMNMSLNAISEFGRGVSNNMSNGFGQSGLILQHLANNSKQNVLKGLGVSLINLGGTGKLIGQGIEDSGHQATLAIENYGQGLAQKMQIASQVIQQSSKDVLVLDKQSARSLAGFYQNLQAGLSGILDKISFPLKKAWQFVSAPWRQEQDQFVSEPESVLSEPETPEPSTVLPQSVVPPQPKTIIQQREIQVIEKETQVADNAWRAGGIISGPLTVLGQAIFGSDNAADYLRAQFGQDFEESQLAVQGKALISDDLVIGDHLTVQGKTDFKKSIKVGGNAEVAGDLYVDGTFNPQSLSIGSAHIDSEGNIIAPRIANNGSADLNIIANGEGNLILATASGLHLEGGRVILNATSRSNPLIESLDNMKIRGSLEVTASGSFNTLSVSDSALIGNYLDMTAAAVPDTSSGRMYYDSTADIMYYYNGASWVDMSGGGASGLFTDAGSFAYLTTTIDDVVFGDSATSTAPFFFDVSASRLTIGTDTNLYRSAADILSTDDSLIVGANLTVSGTTAFNGITYTWPSVDGSSGQLLSTSGSGTLSWANAAAAGLWTDGGAFSYLTSTTDDLVVGASVSASAPFFFDVSANQLTFGGDTNLYRSAANELKTDDSLTVSGTLTLTNASLHILDTDASHDLIIAPGSNLTGDRTLTITTGDSDRTLTLSGSPTLGDWFDQSLKQASSPTFAGLTIDSQAITDIFDQDDLASDSATALATQQSIKAYVDTGLAGISADKIIEGDSEIEVVDTGDGYIEFIEDNAEVMRISGGRLGIATTAPDKALEINSATGANLRLTYNDADGSAANYADFSISSGGNLTINSSGDTLDIDDATISLATQATDFDIIDATDSALTISEGANNYLVVTTTNSSENVSFGNTTTNPSYTFLGSGTVTINGGLDVRGTIENGLVAWWPLDEGTGGTVYDRSIGGHNGTITSSLCPTGYILVPGDATFGTSDFCVMQYEAKNSGGAVSQADLTPWVSITQVAAITACSNAGGHLITNNEWMTIARNVEQVASNWSSGVVGTGCLYRGNNGLADACGYNGSDPEYGTGRDSKASLTLSNGQVIWDLAGNVTEWTNDTCSQANWYSIASWIEWTDANLADYEKPNAGPSGAYTSTHGMGKYYGCTSEGNAFKRGGTWSGTSYAGAFLLDLNSAPGNSYTSFGFRCVR